MRIETYFITGFAVGLELARLDEGDFIIIDLGILRVLISKVGDEDY